MLVPVDENDDEVLILRVVYDEETDEESFEVPADEDAVEAVYELFQDECADLYNFTDGEEP